MKFELTEEGKKYLKIGLPERRLLEILKVKKGVEVEEIKIPELSIAIKWCLEKGWIKKEGKRLILVEYPAKIEEEEALKKIVEGKEVEESLIKVLEKRKLIRKLKSLPKIEVIGTLTKEIVESEVWKTKPFKPYNVEFIGKKIFGGKRHPYVKFLNEVRRKLVELGFKEMEGPLIELEFWNFDALFQPQAHPARDWTDTYRIKFPKFGKLPQEFVEKVKEVHEKGWKYKWNPKIATQLIARAQGTALSARTLASNPEIPGKYFAIARCYRPDVIDVSHAVEFNQVEGIIIGGLNFKHLLGILKLFAEEFANAKKVKFIPDYYPFTEPSVQLSALHEDLGWIEFGGAGIFREEVTKPFGINVPVLAWGLGIDRLAMFHLKINDIRELFSKNLKWLRECQK